MKTFREFLNEASNKKYELTDETTRESGKTLYRIKALKNFGNVKAGDLGGWIESEKNLSQSGNCWVGDDARVWGDAKVFDNAQVYGKAVVKDEAQIYDNARVYGNAAVMNKAKVYGNAQVYTRALITDRVQVYGNAKVYGGFHANRDRHISGNEKLGSNSI